VRENVSTPPLPSRFRSRVSLSIASRYVVAYLRIVDTQTGAETRREIRPGDTPQTLLEPLLRGFAVSVVTSPTPGDGTPLVRSEQEDEDDERHPWQWRSTAWLPYQPGLSCHK